MMSKPVKVTKYDEISKVYDQRYDMGPQGVSEILLNLQDQLRARSLLEAGCGTGHWLNILQKRGICHGLDFSIGMLQKAHGRTSSANLVRGQAMDLPYRAGSFDMVYSVHAIHHFLSPENFIREAMRVLRPGGALAIIGMDPHMRKDRWYIYDYFKDTLITDLARYPSSEMVARFMEDAGFIQVQRSLDAGLHYDFAGKEVFHDPVLQKNGASQLALLSGNDFYEGMEKIKEALQSAHKNHEEIIFPAHILLPAVTGYAPRAF